jgi:hypothetical protein
MSDPDEFTSCQQPTDRVQVARLETKISSSLEESIVDCDIAHGRACGQCPWTLCKRAMPTMGLPVDGPRGTGQMTNSSSELLTSVQLHLAPIKGTKRVGVGSTIYFLGLNITALPIAKHKTQCHNNP